MQTGDLEMRTVHPWGLRTRSRVVKARKPLQTNLGLSAVIAS